jgi:hypothetical protein
VITSWPHAPNKSCELTRRMTGGFAAADVVEAAETRRDGGSGRINK